MLTDYPTDCAIHSLGPFGPIPKLFGNEPTVIRVSLEKHLCLRDIDILDFQNSALDDGYGAKPMNYTVSKSGTCAKVRK